MDEAVDEIIDLLNDENYSELSKLLNKYKGNYACLYLLKAMEDDRCDCPSNHVQVIAKLDELLIDRRPRVY